MLHVAESDLTAVPGRIQYRRPILDLPGLKLTYQVASLEGLAPWHVGNVCRVHGRGAGSLVDCLMVGWWPIMQVRLKSRCKGEVGVPCMD